MDPKDQEQFDRLFNALEAAQAEQARLREDVDFLLARQEPTEGGGGASQVPVAATPGTLLVRIKPYDARAGCLRRRFMIRGQLFDAERGWYEVPESFARELAQELQNPTDPAHSPPVFDVATHEEARRMELQDREVVRPGDYLNPYRPSAKGGEFAGTVRAEPLRRVNGAPPAPRRFPRSMAPVAGGDAEK